MESWCVISSIWCFPTKHRLHILLPILLFKNAICSWSNLPCWIRLRSSSVSIELNFSWQLHLEHSQLIFRLNKIRNSLKNYSNPYLVCCLIENWSFYFLDFVIEYAAMCWCHLFFFKRNITIMTFPCYLFVHWFYFKFQNIRLTYNSS